MNRKSLRRFFSRLLSLLTRKRDEARLREELETHLALQTEANLKARLSAEEARRRAVLKFGAVVSMTITPSSPMTNPVFAPAAVFEAGFEIAAHT